MKKTKFFLGPLLCVICLAIANLSIAQDNNLFEKRAQEVAQNFSKIGDSLEDQFAILRDNNILSSAPPVTSLEFRGVISQLYPYWEDIAPYQYSTVNDHGGTWMYLEVVQIGYGYDHAFMNGLNLPKVYSYPLTNNYGTVYGWVNYYDASVQQSGQAYVQSTSMNYPYNTMYDYLYIQ